MYPLFPNPPSMPPSSEWVFRASPLIAGGGGIETRAKFGFALQDHNNPTRYRNIWVRPLHRYDENAKK